MRPRPLRPARLVRTPSEGGVFAVNRIRRTLVSWATAAAMIAGAAVPSVAVLAADEGDDALSPGALSLEQAFAALDQRSAPVLAQHFSRQAAQASLDKARARAGELEARLIDEGRGDAAAQIKAEVKGFRTTLLAVEKSTLEQIQELRKRARRGHVLRGRRGQRHPDHRRRRGGISGPVSMPSPAWTTLATSRGTNLVTSLAMSPVTSRGMSPATSLGTGREMSLATSLGMSRGTNLGTNLVTSLAMSRGMSPATSLVTSPGMSPAMSPGTNRVTSPVTSLASLGTNRVTSPGTSRGTSLATSLATSLVTSRGMNLATSPGMSLGTNRVTSPATSPATNRSEPLAPPLPQAGQGLPRVARRVPGRPLRAPGERRRLTSKFPAGGHPLAETGCTTGKPQRCDGCTGARRIAVWAPGHRPAAVTGGGAQGLPRRSGTFLMGRGCRRQAGPAGRSGVMTRG